MSNEKDREPDASLSDQQTFQGKAKPKMDELDTRSLGDQATFAGGRAPANPKSLGDQVTFGGGADQGAYVDDDGEVVDIEARYKIEKVLGKGGMGEVLLQPIPVSTAKLPSNASWGRMHVAERR